MKWEFTPYDTLTDMMRFNHSFVKTALYQNCWGEWTKMLDLSFGYHYAYCKKYDIDFIVDREQKTNGSFDRVKFFRENMMKYDLMIYMDIDAVIAQDIDLRTVPIEEDRIGVVHYKEPKPHFNDGVMYVRPGERVRDFMDKWWEGYPGYDDWLAMSVFNDLVPDPCVVALPDEWNSCLQNKVKNPIIAAHHGHYGNFIDKYALVKDMIEEYRVDKMH